MTLGLDRRGDPRRGVVAGARTGCLLRAVDRHRRGHGHRPLRASLHRRGQVVSQRRCTSPCPDRRDPGRRPGQLHLPAADPGPDRRPRLARRARDPRGHPRRGDVPLHALVLRAPDDPGATRARPATRCPRARRLRSRALLAAVGRLLPGHLDRDRHDGAGDPLPARARIHARLRRVRGRPHRRLADPRAPALRSAGLAAAAGLRDRQRVRARGLRHRPHRRGARARRRCWPDSSCSAWATA